MAHPQHTGPVAERSRLEDAGGEPRAGQQGKILQLHCEGATECPRLGNCQCQLSSSSSNSSDNSTTIGSLGMMGSFLDSSRQRTLRISLQASPLTGEPRGWGGSCSVHSCKVKGLGDPPERENPYTPLPPYKVAYNPLDVCQLSVSGAAGNILKPGCPWAGDKFGGRDSSPDPAAMWRDGWDAQVVVLQDVFLDSAGRVFNRTHWFDAGGCQSLPEPVYRAGTCTKDVEEAVNLMAAALPPSAPGTLHRGRNLLGMSPVKGATGVPGALQKKVGPLRGRQSGILQVAAYELPLLLLVLKALPPGSRALLASTNTRFHRLISAQLMQGLPIAQQLRSVSCPARDTLWRMQRLYQPIFQPCGQPSPSLWRAFRVQQLLPPRVAELALRPQRRGERPLVPPSTALLPPDWAVVVHWRVLQELQNAQTLVRLLRQFFPPDRITELSASQPFLQGKALMARAALFITSTPSSLYNAILMPPGATVLELRARRASGALRSLSALGRELSATCGVRHYAVFCGSPFQAQRGSGGGARLETRLWCARKAMLHVIDRAAIDAYTAHPPAPFSRKEESGGQGQAEASLLPWPEKPPGEVARYREWAECVGREGQWAFNATPRALPWEWNNTINLCDHRHEKTGGLASAAADDVARRGGPHKAWNVRESLKYEWVVPEGKCSGVAIRGSRVAGVFERFSGEEFCRRVGHGRTFLFLGDSMQQQFTQVFLNNMLKHIPKPARWALNISVLQDCLHWFPKGSKKHKFCMLYTFHPGVCPGMRVLFVRSDFLTLANRRSFDCMQFTQFPFLAHVHVAIVNRGPHYRLTDIFERDVRATLRYLRNRFPKMLVIFRNTPPGHRGCTGIRRPLAQRQDPKKLPFDWDKFAEQNEVARMAANESDVLYMDVDTMTALRGDGHKGLREDKKVDCLHYCVPGPLDLWAEHLYNTLLRTHPLPGTHLKPKVLGAANRL